MSGIEYFVVPEGANWKIRVQDQDFTRHDTLREAIEAAMEAARAARKCGFAADVFVPRAQGGWASVCL
jgi:Uncharacterized protein conserved in bacteria (DUF2188)